MICYRKLRQIIYILICIPIVFLLASYRKVEDETFNSSTDSSQLDVDTTHQKIFCQISIEAIYNDTEYPECLQKLKWMKNGWQTEKCYADYGVDGSDCTAYEYMANVENHCRSLSNTTRSTESVIPSRPAPLAIDNLMERMSDHPTNYAFLKHRIQELYPNWLKARLLVDIKRFQKPEKIYLYLGFLTVKKNNLAEAANKGGPLGELVQWSDLIAAMATLGHDIQIFGSWTRFKSALTELNQVSPCPKRTNESKDVTIFIDIMGLRQIRTKFKTFYSQNKCRFRVLDSFGTHAEFNHPKYFRQNYRKLGAKSIKQNPWGANGLNLKQFLTLYPHTNDNTFLGFVVQTFKQTETKRHNWTVVYGKEAYMWKNADALLKVAAQYTSLHATVADEEPAKDYVNVNFTNHGNLKPPEYHGLLKRSKILLGLGFPIEGPAPLEAVANGAIYLNPVFETPKNRLNYPFFVDKPTFRNITSQNFYMDRFVGPPYVINFYIEDEDDIHRAFRTALSLTSTPQLPYEFTFEGMLERVSLIVNNMDYCSSKKQDWPPFAKSGQIIEGDAGQSCDNACASKNLLCAPEFFKYVNHPVELKRRGCHISSIVTIAEPYAPSKCTIQEDPLLFSCATVPPLDIIRLCPCRTFNDKQSILCANC
ncbi:unnamed protein product [Bursaphelenchus okinawaensis]|uniref:alpha-1,6-mannosyl-glycoprotein 6-beta-N-acetylglucosaminyltransferase n=1 Tax=Bursaphelenchus okinawaensis TaxID=465554 RepID=A0A811JWI0_9BILA|nr:unnamed protein product [Bursaphelenchus okinawaensis]CAG9086770.1 unnamed protein product [Bursaphelenchus okinawaensis]